MLSECIIYIWILFVGQLICSNPLCTVNSLKRATFWVEPMGRSKAQVGICSRFCYCCLCPLGLLHKFLKPQLPELICSFLCPCYCQHSSENLKRNTQKVIVKTPVSPPWQVTAMMWWRYISRISLCLHTIFHCPSFQVCQSGIQQKKMRNKQLE